tara:strand:+ start:8515 stop:9267 length:753 start_codon:yes stop_codon:yes gene_type:complete
MKETKQQFPSEEVTLPSKGLLYPKSSPLSKGVVEMKYMTAREEDILTNQALINKGTVIDKLLQSLIVTDINYNDLLTGDKNAILIAARVLGYGSDYEFSYGGQQHKVNLTEIEDKELDEKLIQEDGKNEFTFTLPTSKVEVTFKLLTHKDELKIEQELKGLQKLNKNTVATLSTRMKHIITSINGDYENKTIRKYVDTQLLAKDARALRNYITEINPDVDLSFEYEENNGDFKKISIPIGLQFFWPDVEL